ncbi:MAG: NUDIX domain-containing protein [Actinobacteria bacterium]|nr:NUDIX domain-containing protein [Actinomycetota bacterium]
MSTVRQLVAALGAHAPRSPAEAHSVRRVLAHLRWLPNPFDEDADPTHVTGSAIVVDERGRVLLHRHKRLGIWLQPGGHLDPGEDPATAAVRETLEETGLVAAHPAGGPRLLHVDVHEGPRGHVHLDLRYLLRAAGADAFAPGAGESEHVAWFDADEARRVGDRSLAEAVAAAGDLVPAAGGSPSGG